MYNLRDAPICIGEMHRGWLKVYLFNNGVHKVSELSIAMSPNFNPNFKMWCIRPNTQDIACILVYVSFMVIVDNKKFKTC